jgi:hypothetical protein
MEDKASIIPEPGGLGSPEEMTLLHQSLHSPGQGTPMERIPILTAPNTWEREEPFKQGFV